MTNLLATALFVLLVIVVIALLERVHRRAAGLPHAPCGADVACDADLQRVLHDLDARG